MHTRHVENFSSGRCFLAGDAAHIHTPAGGQGMNTGIQDTYNLAWKLAFVLRGKASAKLLDSYNEERLPNAKKLLRTTDRMFNLVAGSNKWVSIIRTRIFPPLAKYIVRLNGVKKRFFPLISQIGINYRQSPLSQHVTDKAFAIKAGDRMPYFLIDNESIYSKLYAPKFHLLTFTNSQDDLQNKADEIKTEYADMLDYQILTLSLELEKVFGVDKSFTVLLRPDNHIALISTNTSLDKVELYLNEVIAYA